MDWRSWKLASLAAATSVALACSDPLVEAAGSDAGATEDESAADEVDTSGESSGEEGSSEGEGTEAESTETETTSTTEGEEPECGNGVVEGDEECDDGNLDDSDACTSECMAASCEDGIANGGEWGLDCGGDCQPCDAVFEADGDTLAIFELNGDLLDSSGNDNHAEAIGGGFVDSAWGQGLELVSADDQGFDWSAHADLLVAPYSVEFVLTPEQTNCWQRLYAWDAGADPGWYYCNGFQSFPTDSIGGGNLPGGARHYLALVSPDGLFVDVYFDGELLGTTDAGFTPPGPDAVFFNDDAGADENISAVVEAVRLSSVVRSEAELAAVQARLELQP